MGSRAIGKLHALVASLRPRAQARDRALPRNSSLSFDWTAVWLSTWLLCGVLMDGWAHNHFGNQIDTFFTPWHAVLYSGYLAVAAFHIWTAFRYRRKGHAWSETMPHGYG